VSFSKWEAGTGCSNFLFTTKMVKYCKRTEREPAQQCCSEATVEVVFLTLLGKGHSLLILGRIISKIADFGS
jgi:hypothetical protein